MKRKHGLTPLQRIERHRTITPDGCWEVDLDKTHEYPQLTVNGKKVSIHRIAYAALVGEIPEGQHVCHRCDNPRCHNPDHLFLGNWEMNMRDMAAKGRHRGGPPQRFNRDRIVALAHLPQTQIAMLTGASQAHVSRVLLSAGLSRGRKTTFGKVKTGGQHGRSLFTEAQVLEIRADKRSSAKIAEELGVSPSTIHAIKARRTWKHI